MAGATTRNTATRMSLDLLLSLYRLDLSDVRMTRERIANMPGVRRAGVTETRRGNRRTKVLFAIRVDSSQY